MITRRKTLASLAVSAGLGGSFLAGAADSATWPTKPVKILVSAAAGGQPDAVARLLADHLSRKFGQPFFVDNRVGANGFVGLQSAALAPADGYTLVWGIAAWFAINPAFYQSMPYNADDFVPVSQIGTSPHCLFVQSALGVKTLKEFVALAKQQPGKLTYASTGNGSSSQMNTELFKLLAGVDILSVPYKSSAAAAQDLAGGRVDAMIIDFAIGDPLVKLGGMTPLAVTGNVRWPKRPTLPTFAEQGYNIDAVGWNGVFFRKGTPSSTVDAVATAIHQWAHSTEGHERLLAASLIPTGTTAQQFDDIVKRDFGIWKSVVQKTGLRPE